MDIIVPIGHLDAHRLRAWNWVHTQYSAQHPKYNVIVGRYHSRTWVKAKAVEDGLAQSRADTIVIADADVWIDKLDYYVDAVDVGGIPWACPHFRVFRFNPLGTSMVIGGMHPVDVALCRGVLAQTPYQRLLGGGIVILKRSLYDEVPLDPRFAGWGGEDSSWGLALATIAGRRVQGEELLWHLWHPPQERMTRVIGNEVSERLHQRYKQAAGNVGAMKELVAEGQEWASRASS